MSHHADREVRGIHGARSARELVILALRQWRAGDGFADAILTRLLKSSDLIAPDRTFSTELFYGILRNLSLLDSWIDSLRSERLEPDPRDLLRLGLYQLFLLNTPEHAAVHETVKLAGVRTRSLINAVLRKALREKDKITAKESNQDLSVRYSHPQFLIDRWRQNFGMKNTVTLCEWNNRPAQIYARINRLNISVEEFFSQHSDAEPVAQHDNFARLASVPHGALARGHCYIQDPSTAAACLLLDPVPGERVLDACAAPGGKTGYLAELMKNQGVIMACERDAGRITALQANLERLGVQIARITQHDWANNKPPSDSVPTSPFDRILVDVPCSNTGVMGRRVDLRWRLVPKDFLRMQQEQLRILRATIPLLKISGTLVYSTCSIEPEENKEVIDAIRQEFSDLRLIEQTALLPFRDGFDGIFAAKLRREKQ